MKKWRVVVGAWFAVASAAACGGGTDDATGTMAGGIAGSGSGAGSVTGSVTGTEPGSGSGSGSGTGSASASETEAGSVTDSGSESGLEAGSETGSETGSEAESESETGSETGSESGSESETGSEPETEPTPGPFPAVTDFTQLGPYTSATLANVGPGNNYYVYYPAEPAPEGAAGNPIVAWTSGGGTSHTFYTLLPHLASHGFVVITSNTIPGIGSETQLGDEMVAGIDWLLEEHARAGSELQGRLDTSKIAASGYSMGSLATFTIAMDARLTTTVHVSGGNMAPERVNNLHAPAAFICGNPDPACTNLLDTTCDIAGANCATDFENATTPVFYATFDSGHLGILTSPFMERINAMATAWLRHHLMGDTTLAGMFEGPDCTYCSDPNWTIQKNYD
jgi:hypothetical protein